MKYKKKPVAIEAFQFDGDLKGSDGKYYVTVSGYIQEVRFDTDSTLHQLLRKAGKLYRSEEEAKRYLDKDYKDLIIQEEE